MSDEQIIVLAVIFFSVAMGIWSFFDIKKHDIRMKIIEMNHTMNDPRVEEHRSFDTPRILLSDVYQSLEIMTEERDAWKTRAEREENMVRDLIEVWKQPELYTPDRWVETIDWLIVEYEQEKGKK